MKTIFILIDSLNRHYLSAYNESWISTPNLNRLADRSVIFENHFCGSMPCIPARRDIMTGRIHFLETPWGPIEPWDDCLPTELREQHGTYSHMITDHYHYFHDGGYGYNDLFDTWEFQRGQENDHWHPLVNYPPRPHDARGRGAESRPYWANRQFRDPEREEDYSTPQCFMRAMEFLKNNHTADNWHLHLEVFDPHEPFECPEKYRALYNDTWDQYFYNWPDYAKLDPKSDDAEAVAHIQKSYAGTLTMVDTWLGKLLDKMDELDLWKDTALVLTTDHGCLLGEHGYWAKNYMFDFAELAHIPLFIYAPGVEGGRRLEALTSTMDLMPTILDLHGATLPPHVHGQPLTDLLTRDGDHHDAVLYGYFGKDINLTDGRFTYCRQPEENSVVYHHTGVPGFNLGRMLSRSDMVNAEIGHFLKHTHGIPHYRMAKPSHHHADAPEFNLVFDLLEDPGQTSPIREEKLEKRFADKMKELLVRFDAPECQFTRTGL